jgi:hypothetical protein
MGNDDAVAHTQAGPALLRYPTGGAVSFGLQPNTHTLIHPNHSIYETMSYLVTIMQPWSQQASGYSSGD